MYTITHHYTTLDERGMPIVASTTRTVEGMFYVPSAIDEELTAHNTGTDTTISLTISCVATIELYGR